MHAFLGVFYSACFILCALPCMLHFVNFTLHTLYCAFDLHAFLCLFCFVLRALHALLCVLHIRCFSYCALFCVLHFLCLVCRLHFVCFYLIACSLAGYPWKNPHLPVKTHLNAKMCVFTPFLWVFEQVNLIEINVPS